MNHRAATDPEQLIAPRGEILFAPLSVGQAAAIAAIMLLAYLPAMRAGFIWDDDSYVTENAALKAPDGLRRIWLEPESTPQYYPLVFTALRIEYGLWGLHPAGYHVVNILLHAANALLLWRVLLLLRVPGAWVAALLFGVHPVQVESVAWVAELKNVLSGFFYFAAFWAALRFYLGTEPGLRRWVVYGGAFLLFACALLSKTATCSLPAAILLILWWKRGRVSRGEVLTLLPFFALGAALAFHTAILEKGHVGAVGAEWELSFLQRVLLAGRALWFYAAKLVWPAGLTFVYPRWQLDPGAAWQYLFPAAAIAVLVILWLLRGRLGRGPLAAALFFALTLAPALGFVNVYPMRFSFVADHFQYLASIGLIVAVAAAVASWRVVKAHMRATGVLCAAILAALGALTWRQCLVYRDAETVWRDTLCKNPDALMALDNLGEILVKKGMKEQRPARAAALYGEAIKCFDKAIALDPGDAVGYNNRGRAYVRVGRHALALRDYDRAITLNPYFFQAYSNRGNVYVRAGLYDLALRDYDRAIALNPKLAEAYGNRAVAHYRMKQYNEALADVKTAQELGDQPHPDFLKALRQAAERAEQ